MFTPNINQYFNDTIYRGSPYYNLRQYPATDYRSIATYHFQILAAFCYLSNSTIVAALKQLKTQNFVNSFLLAPHDFDMQITLLTDQLILTVSNAFIQSLRLIQIAMHTNALFTITTSNWQFYPSDLKPFLTVRTQPVIYNKSTSSCSCALTPLCVQSATMDNVTLPGLMVGCFPLESLLQSTLELLYNRTLVNFLSKNINETFNALDESLISQYKPTITTVESILSQLMVEQWESVINETSYAMYYAQCSPSSCAFTYIKRQNLIVNGKALLHLEDADDTGSIVREILENPEKSIGQDIFTGIPSISKTLTEEEFRGATSFLSKLIQDDLFYMYKWFEQFGCFGKEKD
ncbi:hypothetical protein I4U23_016064 [Adineta vaga]|nr:hypothetical protein I4U23_016064 [Adineta vaga]